MEIPNKIGEYDIEYSPSSICFKLENTGIGYIDADWDGFFKGETDSIEIFMMFIIPSERRQGHGRKIIKELFKMGIKEIKGDSMVDAIKFWDSLGAEFYYGTDDETIKELKEDCQCNPFELFSVNKKIKALMFE